MSSITKKHKDNSPSIYVIFIKNGRLETYTFSTIDLAKIFIKDLSSKEYVILVGHLATDALKNY